MIWFLFIVTKKGTWWGVQSYGNWDVCHLKLGILENLYAMFYLFTPICGFNCLDDCSVDIFDDQSVITLLKVIFAYLFSLDISPCFSVFVVLLIFFCFI